MAYIHTLLSLLLSAVLVCAVSIGSAPAFAPEVDSHGWLPALLVLVLVSLTAGLVLFLPSAAVFTVLRRQPRDGFWWRQLQLLAYGAPWLWLIHLLHQSYDMSPGLPSVSLSLLVLAGAWQWQRFGWRRQSRSALPPGLLPALPWYGLVFGSGLLIGWLQPASPAGSVLGMAGTLGLVHEAWRHYRSNTDRQG